MPLMKLPISASSETDMMNLRWNELGTARMLGGHWDHRQSTMAALGQKQTFAVHKRMFAFYQKRTSLIVVFDFCSADANQ